MLLWTSFLIAFGALLPLVNPLGSALVFLGLAGNVPPAVYRKLARKIAINNIIFLLVIELLGAAILNFFGISLPIVQFSGGIVIAAMGWKVLNEKDEDNDASKEEAREVADETQTRILEQKVFYPFTFPVTSGPGTLVALLTLTAHISDRTLARNLLGHLGVFLAVVALSVLVYFCYAYAPKINKVIPASTAHGILRVIAFILFCIGVQIAWNGLSVLIATVLRA